MKKSYGTMLVLMLLCLGITAIFLEVAPDRVPMHYDFQGEVDRMGSKWEMLIFPGFAIGMGLFFMIMAWAHKESPKDEKVLNIVGIATMVFFNVLSLVLMYKAVTYDPAAQKTVLPDIIKISAVGIGVLMAVLGVFLPKVERNGFMGLRTKWSLSGDEVWKKSQRASGIMSVVCGLGTIICALFLSGMKAMIAGSIWTAVWIGFSIWASYVYYKQEQEKTSE